MEYHQRFTYIVLTLTLLLLLNPALATTYYVDDEADCNDTSGSPYYCTIQAAIDSAGAGSTVDVAPGLFQEDVIINKSINLQGAGRDATTVLRDTGTETIRIAASNVNITRFRVDGGGGATHVIAFSTLSTYNNTELTNCHILNCTGSAVYLGVDAGQAVGANHRVNDNIIEYFGEHSGCGGIYTYRVLGVEVKRNTITNSNPWVAYGISHGGTGIYFFDYTSGIIADNNISLCWGAIMVNSNVAEVYITNNTITKCPKGILQTESFAKIYITGNTITTAQDPTYSPYAELGIHLGGDGDQYDSSPPYAWQVDNLQHEVSGNILTGTLRGEDSVGIKIQPGMIDRDYGASGNITDNTISNYDIGLKVYGTYRGGSVDMTAHVHTSFTHNTILNYNTSATVDTLWSGAVGGINATHNWWGYATGQTGGSDDFMFSPWIFIDPTQDYGNMESTSCNTSDVSIITNTNAGITLDLGACSGSGMVGTASYPTSPPTSMSLKAGTGNDAIKYFDVFFYGISGNVKITVSYTKGEVAHLDESALNLYMWYDNKWNLGSTPGRNIDTQTVWGTFPANKLTGTPGSLGSSSHEERGRPVYICGDHYCTEEELRQQGMSPTTTLTTQQIGTGYIPLDITSPPDATISLPFIGPISIIFIILLPLVAGAVYLLWFKKEYD